MKKIGVAISLFLFVFILVSCDEGTDKLEALMSDVSKIEEIILVANPQHDEAVDYSFGADGDFYIGRFRPIFYNLPGPFVHLVGPEVYHSWHSARSTEEHENENVAVSFIKYFDISREDFERANREWEQSIINWGDTPNDRSRNELYLVDLIFTFDNKTINNFFAWEGSIFAWEVGLAEPPHRLTVPYELSFVLENEISEASLPATVAPLIVHTFDFILEVIAEHPVPRADDYILSGWYIYHHDERLEVTDETRMPAEDTTIYARWLPAPPLPTNIAVGMEFSLVLMSDNTLRGWGWNQEGQLGIDTPTASNFPQVILELMDGVTAISSGASHTMAIMDDGNLWTWGRNAEGQIGNGTVTNTSTPVRHPVKIMDDVIYISAGHQHSAAIQADGSLWVWGGAGGVVGDGTTTRRPSPVRIMDDVVAVSAGVAHTMAIRADGSLWGWGVNNDGRLGDGSLAQRNSPVHIMDDVIAVSAGFNHTLAIRADGSLWAWGNNVFGQLGDGTTINRNTPVRIMNDVTHVSAGQVYSQAIRADGSLWGWGNNRDGFVGDGSAIQRNSPVWVMDDVIAVEAGIWHTMALGVDGGLWIWGNNSNGRLADGTRVNRHSPGLIMGGEAAAPLPIQTNRIGAGNAYSFVIMPDNSLWGRGVSAPHGSIGDGTIINRPEPVHIMNNVAAVSTSFWHSMGLMTDGSLWTWGRNFEGQIGDGTWGGAVWGQGNAQDRHSPVRIMDNVAYISAGSTYSMAITADGTLWGWGQNLRGQIGDGTATAVPILAPVRAMDDVIAVSASGGAHTMAIRRDNSLWTWGDNASGQLGDGTTTIRRFPAMIMDSVVKISAGNSHSMAVRADGGLWAWGANNAGQLGNGTLVNRNAPIHIMDDVVAVSAGNSHSIAIRADGSLWAWGLNTWGQLGDGTTTNRNSPVKIMDNVTEAVAGLNYTMVVTADGSLWAWGQNHLGQLGDGTTVHRHSPVLITSSLAGGGILSIP